MEQEDFIQDQDLLYVHHRVEVDPGQVPLRIDRFLMDRLPHVSRNKLQGAIKCGFIKVNEQSIKPNYKVRPLDQIVVALPKPPPSGEVIPQDIPLDIIFEDEALLIVNKPAGMVVHPAYKNWQGTLVNALTFHFQNLPNMSGNEGRPGLVHRIDKDTSGLLVVAKTESAMTHLAKQFFDHSIERKYVALVWGTPQQASGRIDAALGRSPKDRRIVMTFEDNLLAKHAVTHYKILEDLHYVSLLECQLETGRTHQIRAHMVHLGHPLFADETYGGKKIIKGTSFSKYKAFVDNCFQLMPRQALHAQSLGFIHPLTGRAVHFEVPLPSDFEAVLKKWRGYVVNH